MADEAEVYIQQKDKEASVAPVSLFEEDVRSTLTNIGDMLVAKNKAYGNSALSPVRIFSQASTEEQLLVRLDDKLSRLARGSEYPGDDTITDIIGYLILLQINKGKT